MDRVESHSILSIEQVDNMLEILNIVIKLDIFIVLIIIFC